MGTFNARYFPVLQLELPVYSAEDTLAIISKFLGEWGFLSTLQIFHMESQYLKLSVTSTVGLSKDELDAHTALCLSRLEGHSAFGLAPALRDISQNSRCQHSHRDKEKGHVEDTTDLQEKKPNSGSMLLKTKTNPTETELQDSLNLCAHAHPRQLSTSPQLNLNQLPQGEHSRSLGPTVAEPQTSSLQDKTLPVTSDLQPISSLTSLQPGRVEESPIPIFTSDDVLSLITSNGQDLDDSRVASQDRVSPDPQSAIQPSTWSDSQTFEKQLNIEMATRSQEPDLHHSADASDNLDRRDPGVSKDDLQQEAPELEAQEKGLRKPERRQREENCSSDEIIGNGCCAEETAGRDAKMETAGAEGIGCRQHLARSHDGGWSIEELMYDEHEEEQSVSMFERGVRSKVVAHYVGSAGACVDAQTENDCRRHDENTDMDNVGGHDRGVGRHKNEATTSPRLQSSGGVMVECRLRSGEAEAEGTRYQTSERDNKVDVAGQERDGGRGNLWKPRHDSSKELKGSDEGERGAHPGERHISPRCGVSRGGAPPSQVGHRRWHRSRHSSSSSSDGSRSSSLRPSCSSFTSSSSSSGGSRDSGRRSKAERRNNNDQPTNVEGIVVREKSMEELDVLRPKQGGAPKFVPRAPKAPLSSSRARFATTARDRRPHQHMTPRAVSMAGSGACNGAARSFYPARWEGSSYHQEHDPHFYDLIPGQKSVMVRIGLNNGASLERCASSTAWAPGYDKYGIALLRGGSSGYGHGGKVVQYVNTEAEPTPKRSEDFHCTKRSEDFHCNARHSSLSEFERSHGAVRLRGHSPEVRTRMSNSMAERYDVVAKLSPAQLTRDTQFSGGGDERGYASGSGDGAKRIRVNYD